MHQRHRLQRHLLSLWGRKAREERALADATLREEAEQRMARRRILDLAADPALMPLVPALDAAANPARN